MELSRFERFSSEVTLRLLIDGQELEVWQVGPDFFELHKPFSTATTNATLVITVDGNERRQQIVLPQGLSAGREKQSYF